MKIEHDRSYWRLASTKELIEAARYSDNELAIALGERLARIHRDVRSIEDLEAEIEDLRDERNALRDELDGED